ncbi:hypothetical protein AAC387_Pa02g0815 [Persea americana]
MGFNMAQRVGAMALIMVCLYANHCMGQSAPRALVSQAYFNSLLSAVGARCEGKSFYTYDGFIRAAELATSFGTAGSDVLRKREVAAFLANAMHETGGFCYVSEIRKSDYCDSTNTQWPCAAGKRYFGRGPLQLTWNYNYGKAGQALGFDGLNNPDIVSQDPMISFRTAFWFWMNKCHDAIIQGRGFGATIRAINGGECKGRKPTAVNRRISYYRRFCRDFGVDPGLNLSC